MAGGWNFIGRSAVNWHFAAHNHLIIFIRYDLRQYIRKQGRQPTIQQRTSIVNRQQRLLERLNSFRKKATSLMGPVVGALPQLIGISPLEEEWNDQDQEYVDSAEAAAFDGLLELPEASVIPLPSSYLVEDIHRMGWGRLLAQEIQLRESHAHDTLRSLRLAIGERSMCYKKVVRIAKSQAASTRSQAKVELFTHAVEKHAATYKRNARVLWKLGKSKEQWPDITRQDLQVKGDVTDANRVGQSSYKLAWFWRTGDPGDALKEADDSPAMQECMY